MNLSRRTVAATIVVLVIAAVAVVEYLNFSGFCYPQRRYLSSNELIASAIQDNLRRHSPAPNATRRKMYVSLEEFYQQNPDCCELSRWDTGPFGNSVLLRLLGHYEALVNIVYRINDGPGEESFYGSMTLVGSCGAVHEVRGFPMAKNIRVRE